MEAIYNGSNSFRVFDNRTSEFVTGRRVKMDCTASGIKYASVVSSSYAAPYTTVEVDESELSVGLTDVWYSIATTGATGSLPDHTHDGSEGSGGTVSGTGGGGVGSEIFEDMEEPTGFVTYKVGSSVTYSGSVVSITGTYEYYIKGTKYQKSGEDSVNVSGTTEGDAFIYFDEDTLTYTTAWSNDILSDYAYVAELYWNDDTNEIIHLGDERHGMIMDSATHRNLHLGEGTRYVTGLGLVDMVVDGDGSSDTHAQFGVNSGIILDEDLQHNIGATASGSTIPVFYKDGSNGYWRKDTQTGFAFLSGASYPKYNLNTAGTWSQPEIPNGDFVLCHLFATNDFDDPIIAVMGQDYYDGNTAARAGANDELNNLILSGLPFAEFVALGTVIIGALSTYTNSVNAKIVSTDEGADYVDWRSAKLNPTGANITDHGDLSGLSDYDHPQYVPWNFGSSTISGTGDIYCNDIYTSSGTVYIGELKLSTDGTGLLVNDAVLAGRTTYVGTGAPTVSNPLQAEPYDYYIDSYTSLMYERQDTNPTTIVDDDFTGTTLDTGTWTAYEDPDGEVTQDDVLELTNTNNQWTFAHCYTASSFSKTGLIKLSCKWKPHTNHDSTYSEINAPMISFRDASAGRFTTYQYPYTKMFGVELGNSNDGANRTRLGILEATANPVDTVSINIDESQWHDLILTVNCDTREFTVDLNDGDYTISRVISQVVWDTIASFYLEFSTQEYSKANTEQFDDVLLTTEAVSAWSELGRTGGSFISMPDTPSTYSGIEGNYLRTTASGITTVSGIILEAPDSSEWLLQVTNSGTLYTTEVV